MTLSFICQAVLWAPLGPWEVELLRRRCVVVQMDPYAAHGTVGKSGFPEKGIRELSLGERGRRSWPNHLGGRDVSRGDSANKGVKRESWGNVRVYKDRLISRVNLSMKSGVDGTGWAVRTRAWRVCMLLRLEVDSCFHLMQCFL